MGFHERISRAKNGDFSPRTVVVFYEDISRDPMGIIWVNFNKTMGS
jgi:hypothetical protein